MNTIQVRADARRIRPGREVCALDADCRSPARSTQSSFWAVRDYLAPVRPTCSSATAVLTRPLTARGLLWRAGSEREQVQGAWPDHARCVCTSRLAAEG